MTNYTFQRGETITLALDCLTGDPFAVLQVDAAMKALPPGRRIVDAGAPVAAAFAVSPRAAEGDNTAGWTLTIPAEISALLPAGNYLADARLELAGSTVITDTLAITLRESVTP